MNKEEKPSKEKLNEKEIYCAGLEVGMKLGKQLSKEKSDLNVGK